MAQNMEQNNMPADDLMDELGSLFGGGSKDDRPASIFSK